MKSSTRTITTAAVMTSGIVFTNHALDGEWPPSRQLTGIAIAFFMIAALSDMGAGSVASLFALLLLVGITLDSGPQLFDKIQKKTGA